MKIMCLLTVFWLSATSVQAACFGETITLTLTCEDPAALLTELEEVIKGSTCADLIEIDPTISTALEYVCAGAGNDSVVAYRGLVSVQLQGGNDAFYCVPVSTATRALGIQGNGGDDYIEACPDNPGAYRGGDGNDIIALMENGLEDFVDCGPGEDQVHNVEADIDIIFNCESIHYAND